MFDLNEFKEKGEYFFNRLKKNRELLGKKARKMGVEAYRVYGKDIPEFPFIIDIYKKNLHVSLHASMKKENEKDQEWIDFCLDIISRGLCFEKDKIFLKKRFIQKRDNQYEKLEEEAFIISINEGGYEFIIDLNSYFDTGLFLDHRKTRAMIQDMSFDKRVLNLFSYTCSFSVYALGGGAKEVTSVDMNKNYLKWGEKNIKANSLGALNSKFINQNVMTFLKERIEKKDARYDLIVLDPPSFSRSKKMDDIFDIQKDHEFLIKQCLKLLSKDGIIMFSCNLKKFSLSQNLKKSLKIKDISNITLDFDFEKKRPHKAYLIQTR